MPTLLLIDQFYYNYIKYGAFIDVTKNYKILCVCSTNAKYCTTDPDNITNFINSNNNIVILITYLSLHLLFNTNKYPDFVVFDEAT